MQQGDNMKRIKSVFSFLFLSFIFIFVTAAIFGAADHEHKYTELYTVKPVCTEKGYTVFSCVCGDSYEGNLTDELGHDFSSEVIYYKKATCLEKGEAGRYCKRCYAKSDITYYDKTPHKPVEVMVKATSKKDGEARKECSVCKKLYSRETISKIASVKLESKTYTYDGKVKTPSVAVKDSKGNKLKNKRDYTVKYQKGRKKTGTYSVKITFKGNYEGEKTLYFKIRPVVVRNLSATPSISSVYLSWDKSKGADGYEIYLKTDKLKLVKDTDKLYYRVNKINGKKLKSGTDYTFLVKSYKKAGDKKLYSASKKIKVTTKPQKCRIKKVSTSSGGITVSAVKQNCHGYEFLLSTNKSFSNPVSVRLKGKSKRSYTFKNTIKGKTYYVKVRAYITSGGESYKGYYSEIKKIKG